MKASKVASSGNRVSAPSDDPVAYAASMREDARISLLEARSKTSDRTTSDLDSAETSLASAGDLLIRVREIALQAANGSSSPESRADASIEVDSLQQSLLGLANTRGPNGYIFGGTQTDKPPFDSNGAFVGNDNSVRVEIADGVTTNANASGSRAFTSAGGRDIISDLKNLVTALKGNDVNSIRSSLDQLDSGQRQVTGARVESGLSAERIRSASDVISNALVVVKSARAKDVEADTVEAFSDLQMAQTAYSRGIEVTREILSATGVNRT
jgi:flagellar hook-associated protein 3 FlgL